MAATVCETQHVQIQAGRYRWPSFTTSQSSGGDGSSQAKSKARPSVLRIFTSEAPPTPTQESAAVSASPAAPVRASIDCPSRDASSLSDASAAVREQARLLEPPSGSSPSAAQKSKHAHVRAMSTTAVGEPNRLDSPSVRKIHRARAISSATMGAQPRPRARLPSMLSSVRTNPRAPAQTTLVSTPDTELVGSFAPTSSPRQRLLSILSGERGDAPSSPAPSAPSSLHRAHLRLATSDLVRRSSNERRRRRISSPSSPPSSPPIPSICRTPSSYAGSEYFPTAPSSAGPSTPVHTAATLPAARKHESLHPVLESLERTSIFSVQTACATCGKHGSNFPCCPKCGEMWCSRACRVQKGDGRRHVCARSG